MWRRTSPSPPSGVTRRVPASSAGASYTVLDISHLSPDAGGTRIGAPPRPGGRTSSSRRAGDLRQRTAGGGIAIGSEVGEVGAGNLSHQREFVLDLGGLPLLGTDERQPDTRARDPAEPVQDVLRRDRARDVGHDRP